jgi:tetratricopeptide (TPR) repeat protein
MDDLLTQIKKLKVGVKDNPDALRDMVALSEKYPNEPEVWRGIAYIYGMRGNPASAVDALNRAIALNPDEPVFFFDRAWKRAAIGDYQGTIDDASTGIEMSYRLQFFSYKDLFIFLRAYALVQLGDLGSAEHDLVSMDDHDARLWIGGLVTWEDLARRCGMDVPPTSAPRGRT